MVFMASGGEIQGSENTSPWIDRKRSSLTSLTGTKNTEPVTNTTIHKVTESIESCKILEVTDDEGSIHQLINII